MVGLLRGSFIFIADLVRELDMPVEVDFLEASSYGDGMESHARYVSSKICVAPLRAVMFLLWKILSIQDLPSAT